MSSEEDQVTTSSALSSTGDGSRDYTDFDPITPFSDSKRHLGDAFTNTMATVNLCLGLQALLLNIFVISFYFKKRRDTVPLLYLFVSSTDLLTAVSALMVSLVLFLQEHHTEVSVALVLPAYAIFSVTFKVSVFLNLTVAMARTINIIQPFYRIKNKAFVIATVVYTLGWVIFTVVQLAREKDAQKISVFDAYLFSPGQYQIVRSEARIAECRDVSLFIGLPYLLPSLVVVVCMAVQAYTLLQLQPQKSTNTDVQKNITTTIFMMTVLFFVCNTVYVVYPITRCAEVHGGSDIHSDLQTRKEVLRRDYRMRFLAGVVAPFVNAAFNPLILISRGTALKAAIKKNSRKLTVSLAMTRPSRISGGGTTVFMNLNSVTDANGTTVVPKRDSKLELSVNCPKRAENCETPPGLSHKDSKVRFSETTFHCR